MDIAKKFEQRRISVTRWREQRMAEGLCSCCGSRPLANGSPCRCDVCQAKHRERQRARRQTTAEKRKHVARESVRYGVKRGKIQKPTTCPRCGSPENIQGHHTDYNAYRAVEWLCAVCHMAEHRVA